MQVKIEPGWGGQLAEEFNKPYFSQLTDFVRSEYQTQTIYPPARQIFNAFHQCPWDKLKVVILGQDPYHSDGQAMGLCFSVNDGIQKPPSLNNIFKELRSDIGKEMPQSGNLIHWAKQGVLLLNTVLTVRAGLANSHKDKGWEIFTDAVIGIASERKENLVFILWGSPAQKKGAVIDTAKHLVLKSVHPSPLSAERGFFGNHHFSKTNNWLVQHGLEPVAW